MSMLTDLLTPEQKKAQADAWNQGGLSYPGQVSTVQKPVMQSDAATSADAITKSTTNPLDNVGVVSGIDMGGNTFYASPDFQNNTPSYAEVSQWNPTTANVGQNQLVDYQVGNILSQNGPLMQQAMKIANEGSNSRGLLNSSIANENALNAAIQSVLPMAQQNAQTYTNQALTNQGYQNDAGQFNAGQLNQASQFNSNAYNQAISQASAQDHEFVMAQQNFYDSLALQQDDWTSKLEALGMELNNNVMLQDMRNQASQYAADLQHQVSMGQLNWSQASSALNLNLMMNEFFATNTLGIMSDPDMSQADKDSMLAQLQSLYTNMTTTAQNLFDRIRVDSEFGQLFHYMP